MSTNPNSPSKPKPPYDYLPWIYWIPFLIIVPIIAVWMANKPMTTQPQIDRISLPLLYREVPGYHIITSSDIHLGSVNINAVATVTNPIREMQDLIGHYTLAPVLPNQPIPENQIGPKPDPTLISNTLAVAIPANSATLLGGNLYAGDVVSLAAVPLSSAGSPPVVVFREVLVLDVKSTGNQAVIILAIPINRWLDYLAQTRDATLVLAQQVTDHQ